VLEAALRRQLPAEQRAVLVRHLREPCEACLDLLEGWTAEEMMLAPDELLSRKEQASLFASAAPAELPTRRPALRPAYRERWRLPRLAWTASAAALVVGLVLMLRPTQRNAGGGLKGVAPPAAALIPLVGARTPTPHVVRALPTGGRLAPGELLLLRIRLDAPAWVYLLSQKQGEAAELIWPLQPATRHDAGEFELAESGSALAIDPSALGIGGRLLLIASPEPIDRRRLEIREPLLTREDIERTFAGCGVDLLPVLIEPH
jgi:hypothetical protein